jgi:uncharacterized membrane protein YcgQ (UPF0703/DUF1980 family)
MNRLIVLNRFFYPDHSATSQILTDLRLHFAASGVDVHVITSQQLYDDPSRQLPAKATTAQMRTASLRYRSGSQNFTRELPVRRATPHGCKFRR